MTALALDQQPQTPAAGTFFHSDDDQGTHDHAARRYQPAAGDQLETPLQRLPEDRFPGRTTDRWHLVVLRAAGAGEGSRAAPSPSGLLLGAVHRTRRRHGRVLGRLRVPE
ncbi:hypothetical protein ARTHRO9V_580002 [Arthrobacter sp. 9V]|nr:hypothetical protein CURTO8I2_180124 [Curtobacterium sp. 8I-2]VXC59838.1 hypothetical protein ARTHRO9V_580002 [Arthrobacter sp. 9V]